MRFILNKGVVTIPEALRRRILLSVDIPCEGLKVIYYAVALA
jgi:hypothetical protein